MSVIRTALTALALAGIAGPAFAVPDYFPASSQYALGDQQLRSLDCYGLWHARNEIYARNGYRFVSAAAIAEFGGNGWTSNPRLTQVEQANIAAIQRYERSYRCN